MEKKLRSFLLLKTVTNLETLGLDWVKNSEGNPCFYYKDYDLRNSMPTMLLNFLQANGFYEQESVIDKQSILKKIVLNRQLFSEVVSKQTGLDISVCKQTILSIIYGATLSEQHKKSPLLIELDIEMAFPLAILAIKVVSVYQTVAVQAVLSRETLGVILNEPKLIPSTVRLTAPELGAFLRTKLLPSTR